VDFGEYMKKEFSGIDLVGMGYFEII